MQLAAQFWLLCLCLCIVSTPRSVDVFCAHSVVLSFVGCLRIDPSHAGIGFSSLGTRGLRPRSIALMFSRVLITIMSAYSIWRTTTMATRLRVLIGSTDSPCHFDMFSDYLRIRVIIQASGVFRVFAWLQLADTVCLLRSLLQIPDLVFNVVALILLGCLSWRLLKVSARCLYIDFVAHLIFAQLYSTQTFSYVGPPIDIIKIYVVRPPFQL